MIKIFYINSKNKTKQNNFYFILNFDPFQIFRINFGQNVPVLFHIFRFGLEKLLNQTHTKLILTKTNRKNTV